MKTITISLGYDLKEVIDCLARSMSMSRSAVISLILRTFIDGDVNDIQYLKNLIKKFKGVKNEG